MTERGSGLIVAADVGGTKTDVGLFERDGARLVRRERYRSADHPGLEEVLDDFLAGEKVAAAGIAAAGPVRDGFIRTTNLPWLISAADLARRLDGSSVYLLNDLEAAAAAAVDLGDESLDTIQSGNPRAGANRAVLAAGTGLGQAILFWHAGEYHPSATEGGHVAFGPRGAEQLELLRFMQRHHSQVSYEMLVSGIGLSNLFDFVANELGTAVAPEVAERLRGEDHAAVIGEAAVSGRCEASRRTIELFLRILAARAGDLTLSVMATGGVYIGGGIVPKLLPVLDRSRFRADFAGRGPFAQLLAEVPVWLVTEPQVALLGAAAVAAKRLRQRLRD
jgi:glucokinase